MPSPSDFGEMTLHVEQPMAFSSFGMGSAAAVHQPPSPPSINPLPLQNGIQQQQHHHQFPSHYQEQQHHQQSSFRASRIPSVLSYGNRGSLRGMSITSETTFGRAMSGLSALSIDWENLDDFDVEVDHSAHINGNSGATGQAIAGSGGGGAARSSVTRRSIMSTGSQDGGGAQVSFKVQ